MNIADVYGMHRGEIEECKSTLPYKLSHCLSKNDASVTQHTIFIIGVLI